MPEQEPRNWPEAVKEYLPNATEEETERIKIEHTSPLSSPAELLRELAEYMATQGIGKHGKGNGG